jgi:hypothetical protein
MKKTLPLSYHTKLDIKKTLPLSYNTKLDMKKRRGVMSSSCPV